MVMHTPVTLKTLLTDHNRAKTNLQNWLCTWPRHTSSACNPPIQSHGQSQWQPFDWVILQINLPFLAFCPIAGKSKTYNSHSVLTARDVQVAGGKAWAMQTGWNPASTLNWPFLKVTGSWPFHVKLARSSTMFSLTGLKSKSNSSNVVSVSLNFETISWPAVPATTITLLSLHSSTFLTARRGSSL